MNGRDFTFWLKGYIELTERGTGENDAFGLSATQLALVEQRANQVIRDYESSGNFNYSEEIRNEPNV